MVAGHKAALSSSFDLGLLAPTDISGMSAPGRKLA